MFRVISVINGIPINADDEIIMDEDVKGIWFVFCPYVRRSWLWLFCIIIYPVAINSSALNSACIDVWKKAIIGMFIDRVIVINPGWLRVERAIIFYVVF